MSFFNSGSSRPPFLLPFLVALIFGLPAAWVWYSMTTKGGVMIGVTTVLMGFSCGMGARIATPGRHAGDSAVIATLLLILGCISYISVMLIARENRETVSMAVDWLLEKRDFTKFNKGFLRIAETAFWGYPVALFMAYRVSDAS
jgi:predicted permease